MGFVLGLLLGLLCAAFWVVVYTCMWLQDSGSQAFLAPVVAVPVAVYVGWRAFRCGLGAGAILVALVIWATCVLAARLACAFPSRDSRWMGVLHLACAWIVIAVVTDQTGLLVLRQRDQNRREFVQRTLESGQAGIVMSNAFGWTLVDVWPLSQPLVEGVVVGYELRYRTPEGRSVQVEVYPNSEAIRRAACDDSGTPFPLLGYQQDASQLVVCEHVGFNSWRKRNLMGQDELVHVRSKAIIVYYGPAVDAVEVFASFQDVTLKELFDLLVVEPNGWFRKHRNGLSQRANKMV
jgi:hypothetical protein